MTIPTKYTGKSERWNQQVPVLAVLAAGKLSVLGACQLLGIMFDELHGWRVAFDAYGRGGLRATHRNIIARVHGAS